MQLLTTPSISATRYVLSPGERRRQSNLGQQADSGDGTARGGRFAPLVGIRSETPARSQHTSSNSRETGETRARDAACDLRLTRLDSDLIAPYSGGHAGALPRPKL